MPDRQDGDPRQPPVRSVWGTIPSATELAGAVGDLFSFGSPKIARLAMLATLVVLVGLVVGLIAVLLSPWNLTERQQDTIWRVIFGVGFLVGILLLAMLITHNGDEVVRTRHDIRGDLNAAGAKSELALQQSDHAVQKATELGNGKLTAMVRDAVVDAIATFNKQKADEQQCVELPATTEELRTMMREVAEEVYDRRDPEQIKAIAEAAVAAAQRRQQRPPTPQGE